MPPQVWLAVLAAHADLAQYKAHYGCLVICTCLHWCGAVCEEFQSSVKFSLWLRLLSLIRLLLHPFTLHALREIQFTAREKYNLQCERNQFLSPHRLKYDNILFVFALYLSDAWITNWMEGGSGGRVGARVTTPTSVSPGQRGSLTSLARCCPVRSKEIQFSGLKKYN